MIAGAGLGWWTRGAVCCVSIVVLGWISARLVLRTVEPEFDSPATVASIGGPESVVESVRDLDSRQRFAPIFGEEAQTRSAESAPVARNTTYSLRGLFEMLDGGALAMIESSGITAVYRGRDRLPGGETITEISPDGVTIDGARGRTRIAFEELQVSRPEPDERPPADARNSEADSPGTVASVDAAVATADIEPERRPPLSHTKLSEQILSSESLLSAVRFKRVRVRTGKIGLRIEWLRKDDLTDAIGLQRGDVIVAVNGLSVDDPRTMDALVRTLPTSREVVIDLERRDGPHRVVIPLSHG